MNDVFYFLYNQFIFIIEVFMGFYFFSRLLKGRGKVYYCLVIIILMQCINVFLKSSVWLNIIIYIFFLFLAGTFVYHIKYKISFLYAVLTVEVMQLCYGILNSVLGIISPFLYYRNPAVSSICFMIIGNSLALILSYFCYFIINKYFSYQKIEKNPYVLIITMPLFLIFLIEQYINYTVYGTDITIDRRGTILYINHFYMLCIQIFGIFSLFSIIYTYKKLVDSFAQSTKLSLLEQETYFQRRYTEEAKLRYEKTKAIRHDIKNHLAVVKGFLDRENYKQARKYIESIAEISAELSFPCHTNNPILDIVIGNKLGLAKENGIQVSCCLKVPKSSQIMDMDFCIIMANALDNAVHACKKIKKESFIEISGRRQGEFFLIEIENSCEQNQWENKEGIGLTNIRTVIEKYNGAMNISCQNETFCLSLLLIIPQQLDDISQPIS